MFSRRRLHLSLFNISGKDNGNDGAANRRQTTRSIYTSNSNKKRKNMHTESYARRAPTWHTYKQCALVSSVERRAVYLCLVVFSVFSRSHSRKVFRRNWVILRSSQGVPVQTTRTHTHTHTCVEHIFCTCRCATAGWAECRRRSFRIQNRTSPDEHMQTTVSVRFHSGYCVRYAFARGFTNRTNRAQSQLTKSFSLINVGDACAQTTTFVAAVR